jgi:hypothetical protein
MPLSFSAPPQLKKSSGKLQPKTISFAGASPGAPGRLQRKLQADAYSGYGKLYELGRRPGPILEAARWVRARRPFFVMADLAENARRKAQGKKPAVISPLALEAGCSAQTREFSPHPIRR